REAGPAIVIKASGNFRPPEVNASEISHDRAADHDVVKMRDDEVGVVQVNIGRERGEKEPGEPAHGEKSDEPESVKHRCLIGDRTFVKSRGPIKDFDRGGNGNRETEGGKNKSRVHGLAGDKHVMSPDEKADQ